MAGFLNLIILSPGLQQTAATLKAGSSHHGNIFRKQAIIKKAPARARELNYVFAGQR